MNGWRNWSEAMTCALYGEGGFYVAPGAAARHFRTAAHTGQVWAGAIAELARRVDDAVGHPDHFTVMDVGAGGGDLLALLERTAPARWRLVGVEVASRPAGLPPRIEWRREPPASVTGLLLAVELLDVVPIDVVERTTDGIRLVEVAGTGEERLGPPVSPGDADWLARWWSPLGVGDRAEVGAPRDVAWAALSASVDAGLAVAVDYVAIPGRCPTGTFTGYRAGRQVAPMPDGSMDLTAHVLFDSLRTADDCVMEQHAALRALGVTSHPPTYDGDPETYLTALAEASSGGELLDPAGLGGFTWLLHPVGIAAPLR